MPLTNQDLEAIDKLLDKQKKEIVADTDRKITTAAINISRESNGQNLFKDFQTVTKLRSEIQTSEDNVKGSLNELKTEMNTRFDKISEVLTKISQDLIKYIGEVETDNRKAHKNFDTRLKRIESGSAVGI